MKNRSLVRLVNETTSLSPKIDWEGIHSASAGALERRLGPITVILKSDGAVRKLNRKYRGKDEPSNILSFEESREIVLAPELIGRQARQRGLLPEQWATRLFVHGILHLEGIRHNTPADAQEMESLEEKILARLGL